MQELIGWLTAQIDDDERGALAASGRNDEKPGEFAERWQWVHTGDANPAYRAGHALVDQPVDLERWKDEVHVGGNGPDYADRVSLRSVEEYPTASVGTLPHFVIRDADEVEVVVARHITSFDPARVARELEAKRKIIEAYARTAAEEREKNRAFMTALKCGDGGIENLRQIPLLQADHRDADGRKRGLEQAVRLLALPYDGRPGYREEWRP